MQKLRGPTTVMAKPKTWRQNQKPHGKTKDLMAKPNTSQQKPNTSRQKQIPMAKPKLFRSCSEVFGFATRYFVFAVRYFGFAVMFLSWGFWFCCDVFGFAVTVVGHHKKLQTRQLHRLTVNKSAYLARIHTDIYTPTLHPHTFLSVTPVLQIPIVLQKVYKYR